MLVSQFNASNKILTSEDSLSVSESLARLLIVLPLRVLLSGWFFLLLATLEAAFFEFEFTDELEDPELFESFELSLSSGKLANNSWYL